MPKQTIQEPMSTSQDENALSIGGGSSAGRRLCSMVGSKGAVWIALIIGLIARLWWISVNADAYPAVSDDYNYFHGACGLLNGRGYTLFGQPITHWPPGYSAFLAPIFAVFGRTVMAAYAANLLLTLVSAYLVWKLAERWFKSRWVANVSAVLCLLNLDQVLMCPFVRSEPLHQVLFYLLLLALSPVGGRSGFLRTMTIGLLTGLLAYVRPEYIIVPGIFVLAWHVFGRESRGSVMGVVRSLLIIYTVVILVTLPASVHLKRVTGHWYFMSSAGAVSFFHGNNPYSDGGAGGMENMNQILAGQSPGSYAVHYIATHPGRFIELIPLKFWTTYGVRMKMGSPSDVIVINKLPGQLSRPDVEKALSKISKPEKQTAFLAALVQDPSGESYRLKEGLTDIEKTVFQNALLTTFSYDFQTPRGWVYLRWTYRAYRLLQFGLVFGTLAFLLGRSGLRRRLQRLARPMAGLTVLVGVTGVYLICAGGVRYGFAQLNLLWIFFAFACAVWCGEEEPKGQSGSGLVLSGENER
jgi:hypothetical protein